MLLAVVKDWIHNAVNPFVIPAKQHFRPDAAPIVGEMWFRFKVEERWDPEMGEEESSCGPQTGMLGCFQVGASVAGEPELELGGWGEEDVRGEVEVRSEGAPPMMAPSMNFIAGAEV